jgi:hypothetical protein
MRRQFYGDRKDVLKWTCILTEAGDQKHILYVAMVRPDDRRGCDFASADGRPEVVTFFQRERQAFGGAPIARPLENICSLDSRIVPVLDEFRPKKRDAYFDDVVRRIRQRRQSNWVVFIDPDNGIGRKKPKGEHVTPSELAKIWDSLQTGDVIVLYQHQTHETGWVGVNARLFGSALGLDSADVRTKHHSDVCFYSATKQPHAPRIEWGK